MNDTSTTAYWVAAAVILVIMVIGVALWYSATSTTPALPNTGTETSNMQDSSAANTSDFTATTSSTSSNY